MVAYGMEGIHSLEADDKHGWRACFCPRMSVLCVCVPCRSVFVRFVHSPPHDKARCSSGRLVSVTEKQTTEKINKEKKTTTKKRKMSFVFIRQPFLYLQLTDDDSVFFHVSVTGTVQRSSCPLPERSLVFVSCAVLGGRGSTRPPLPD